MKELKLSDIYSSYLDEINALRKENKRLQEQLNEANEVIKDYDGFAIAITPDGKYARKYPNSAHSYLEKWGVK